MKRRILGELQEICQWRKDVRAPRPHVSVISDKAKESWQLLEVLGGLQSGHGFDLLGVRFDSCRGSTNGLKSRSL